MGKAVKSFRRVAGKTGFQFPCPYTPEEEAALVTRLKQGDRSACAQIVLDFYPLFEWMCHRHPQPEDATQDLCVTFMRPERYRSYDPSFAADGNRTIANWIAMSARTALIDMYDTYNREFRGGTTSFVSLDEPVRMIKSGEEGDIPLVDVLPSHQPGPEQVLRNKELLAAAVAAAAKLSLTQRDLVLGMIHDRSPAETSELSENLANSKSANVVASQLRRTPGMKKLRSLLSND